MGRRHRRLLQTNSAVNSSNAISRPRVERFLDSIFDSPLSNEVGISDVRCFRLEDENYSPITVDSFDEASLPSFDCFSLAGDLSAESIRFSSGCSITSLGEAAGLVSGLESLDVICLLSFVSLAASFSSSFCVEAVVLADALLSNDFTDWRDFALLAFIRSPPSSDFANF